MTQPPQSTQEPKAPVAPDVSSPSAASVGGPGLGLPGDVSAALSARLKDLSAQRGWFIALGVVLIVLGGVAAVHVLAATVASVMFIGVLMVIGGVGQLVHAWRVKGWKSFLLWTLAGLAYAVAGFIAITNPVVGAAVLTLLFGATLIAAGALRLWIWSQNRGQSGWQWLLLSGFVTLLAGVLIAAGWPGNSLWILGLLLAFDLLFQGISVLMVGLALSAQRR